MGVQCPRFLQANRKIVFLSPEVRDEGLQPFAVATTSVYWEFAMPLHEWCQWLQHTPFATAITESDWLFPLIEGSHILALPLSVGMILIADLRLLGLAFCGEATGKIVPSFLRLSRIGFPVMFLTGGLLFITQAGKAYGNPFFRAKLIFLVLLAINAAAYQKLLYPKMAGWDSAQGAPRGAKFCAAFSLVVWIAVIVCGRTMAYQF